MPAQEVELRSPRLRAPRALGDLFTDDRHERLTHALGKAYRDVVRGFRGQLREPPRPRGPAPRRVRGRGGAGVLRGGRGRGDPLRRRHERRRRRRAAAGGPHLGLARPAPPRPRARGRPGLARRPDPGGHARPGARGPAPRARPHAPPLPPVVRVLVPWRLGRDPGRRPLRDALHPHRRPGRVGAGDHPAREVGEPPPSRLGRGALAGPGADRLRGDPGGDHRGLGPGAASARRTSSPARSSSTASGRERRPSARSRSRACTRPTAGCSTLSRRSTTGAGRRREGPARARLRVPAPPGRPVDGPGARDRPRRGRDGRGGRRRGGRRAPTPCRPGARLS